MLVSKVTAALRASARPFRVAPLVTVMEVSARMLPLKVELVPRVAELPTCQKTLFLLAPPARTTELLLAVVRDEPIWKIQTALALPVRVRVPLIANEEVDL